MTSPRRLRLRHVIGALLVSAVLAEDFCETETFEASCAQHANQRLLIEQALYGQMHANSRCIDAGDFGCVNDVTALFHAWCSGRSVVLSQILRNYNYERESQSRFVFWCGILVCLGLNARYLLVNWRRS